MTNKTYGFETLAVHAGADVVVVDGPAPSGAEPAPPAMAALFCAAGAMAEAAA